ncbi:DUF1430 domain-containing protein [Paenibacillus sp. J22TS3]|uniref:DUF1430 domain-containing protein n=1 Tax=Paenibacillus sp. J22TS3 TaxID=2807192 RepID=UPI001B114351|nr:DUF1430 domain-containing protein [Paenibacillus sp. J22TS3]GIP22894.1 hypothetical protein J22TS3_31690 [Paenibacillus sp. J22TS3]
MKKIIASFLALMTILTIVRVYIQADLTEINRIASLERSIGLAFVIPDQLILADPDIIYPILHNSASKAKVNLIRPGLKSTVNNQTELVKYVLLTNGTTHLFKSLHLVKGRLLTPTDMEKDEHYLSTSPMGEPNQVGRIAEFGGNDSIRVMPLRLAYQYVPVAGLYYVETKSSKIYEQFIHEFVSQVNTHFKNELKEPFKADSFKNQDMDLNNARSSSLPTILKNIQVVVVVLFLLLLIYSLFHQFNVIGIYHMFGVSRYRIWYLMTGKTLLVGGLLSLLISLMVYFIIPNSSFDFLLTLLKSILIGYAAIVVVSLLPYVLLHRMQISQMVKRRRNTTFVFLLNATVKLVCSLLLILIGAQVILQYSQVNNQEQMLKDWEKSKDYGVFYPLYQGQDKEDLARDNGHVFSIIANRLYPILNDMGSLLINTRAYEQNALKLDSAYKGIRTVKVNNNYLKAYPLLDIHQKQVDIREDEASWIILVPDKYRSHEDEIMKFFRENRQVWSRYEENHYKLKVPDSLMNQKIRIVWLANEQSVFSFNPDVFPTEKFSILDPIIEVVTEKNSFTSDRNTILGNGSADPMKVKLIQRDTALTYERLKPVLRELGLSDNLKTLVSVNEQLLKQLHDLQTELKVSILILVALTLGFVILVIQYLLILFQRYQSAFVVRRLFGLGIFRAYREFFLGFLFLWLLQLVASYLLMQEVTPIHAVVMVIIFMTELIGSVLGLIIVGRQALIKVIKGGGL